MLILKCKGVHLLRLVVFLSTVDYALNIDIVGNKRMITHRGSLSFSCDPIRLTNLIYKLTLTRLRLSLMLSVKVEHLIYKIKGEI